MGGRGGFSVKTERVGTHSRTITGDSLRRKKRREKRKIGKTQRERERGCQIIKEIGIAGRSRNRKTFGCGGNDGFQRHFKQMEKATTEQTGICFCFSFLFFFKEKNKNRTQC
jgi:hypothetical protein